MAAAEPTLTHLDHHGRARMVDVTEKAVTHRRARASCRVDIGAEAGAAVRAETATGTAGGGLSWTELFEAARFAGTQAAKRTAELIPLCHPLSLWNIVVELDLEGDHVSVEAVSEVIAQTGVEMEALTACTVAALTLAAGAMHRYPQTSIGDVVLLEKSGGRSGDWVRDDTGRIAVSRDEPDGPGLP